MIALVSLALAQDARTLLEEAARIQDQGNAIQQVRLTTTSRTGTEKVKELSLTVRKGGDALDVRGELTAPAALAGTRWVLRQADADAHFVLYLPALKTVTRIEGRSRSGSFLGTDFSYEDLQPPPLDAADHALVSESTATWVVDSTPHDPESSAYSRVRTTLDKASRLPTQVDLFVGEAPRKRLEVLATAREGGQQFPTHLVMTDLARGSHTSLEVLSWQLDVPDAQLPDALFDPDALDAR